MAYKIYLYDTDIDCIGSGCLSSGYVQSQLELAGGQDVEVHISSVGGSAFDAIAIYDLLKKYSGNVTTCIDALAASAASIVAMGGKTVCMSKYALLMIHKPMVGSGGNADELMQDVQMLNIVQTRLAAIYMDKTGLDEVTINTLINAVTWLSAEQALDLGFIDTIEDYAAQSVVTNSALIKTFSATAPIAYQRVINKILIKQPEPAQIVNTMTQEEKDALLAKNESFFTKVKNWFKPSIIKVVTDKGDKFVLNSVTEGALVFNDADMEDESEDVENLQAEKDGKKIKMSVKNGKVDKIDPDEDEEQEEEDDNDPDKDDDEIDNEFKGVLNAAGVNFKKTAGNKVIKNSIAAKLSEVVNKTSALEAKIVSQDALIVELTSQLSVSNAAVNKTEDEVRATIKSTFVPPSSKRSTKIGDVKEVKTFVQPEANSLADRAKRSALANAKK